MVSHIEWKFYDEIFFFLSSANGAGKTGQLHIKKKELYHFLTLYTKISLKWIKDLNMRWETIKLLEKNTGRTFSDINHNNIFSIIYSNYF